MSKQPNPKPIQHPYGILALGIALGALIVGTPVLLWTHGRETRTLPNSSSIATRTAPAPPVALPAMGDLSSSTSAFDPAVRQVAARFNCGCADQCGKEVDVCSCSTAQAERTFIRDQLRQGHNKTEAVKALNRKYGGLKT